MKIAGIVLIATLIAPVAYSQGARFGAPLSSASGIDISGTWSYGGDQDSDYGTAAGAVGDFGGIPLNEAGRLYALAWDASRMTVRQQQCAGYGIPYAYFSPGNFRFWEERDPHTQQLIAIHMWFQTSEVGRTIWMDGRPHPPAWARIPSPVFPQGGGTRTCSRSQPLISNALGCGEMGCHTAMKPR